MKYLNGVNYKDCVGKVCKSKSSRGFKVLKYNDSKNVEIQFLNTGHETVARLDNIKSGLIKDPYLSSVYGVGIFGTKYSSILMSLLQKEYELLTHMLQRCYSTSLKKKSPTHEGCEVSDNFKSYEYFYEWRHSQVGFGIEGFELDKELLIKCNKVYSESTCAFLPKEINSVLTKSTAIRGEYLIGTHWSSSNKAFVARVRKNKKGAREVRVFQYRNRSF